MIHYLQILFLFDLFKCLAKFSKLTMNELNKHFGVDESLRTLAQTCSLELTKKWKLRLSLNLVNWDFFIEQYFCFPI